VIWGRLLSPWRAFVTLVVFMGLWQAVTVLFDIPEYLLPPPTVIAERVWQDKAYLLQQSVPTIIEIWAAFGIAVVGGILLGIAIAYSRWAEEGILPIIVSLEVIPKIALAPLFLIWFGFGLAPKIAVATLLCFFPILINTVKGIRSVETEMVQWMSTMGARQRTIFAKLTFPGALPYIFAGMKIAITAAVVGAIVGEWVGSDAGLGYLILRDSGFLDTTGMFSALIVVTVIGVVSFGVVAALERRTLSWQIALEGGPEVAATEVSRAAA
jgi:NitT/TauT family transport system permease protein